MEWGQIISGMLVGGGFVFCVFWVFYSERVRRLQAVIKEDNDLTKTRDFCRQKSVDVAVALEVEPEGDLSACVRDLKTSRETLRGERDKVNKQIAELEAAKKRKSRKSTKPKDALTTLAGEPPKAEEPLKAQPPASGEEKAAEGGNPKTAVDNIIAGIKALVREALKNRPLKKKSLRKRVEGKKVGDIEVTQSMVQAVITEMLFGCELIVANDKLTLPA